MAAIVTAAMLAGCSTAPAEETRSPAEAKKLADALEGRVAGQPQRCISNFPTTQMRVIDDWTILYEEGGTIYVQNPRGGCPGIGNGTRTLVTRQFGTGQICDGDINQVSDLQFGVGGMSCVFGPFTPYSKARS